ncbi:MAG: nicotinic acid mononucleotide adenylyltransferase [Betaproteobacteria bacterium HGW-Betaproteobacteria-11]|nr:MAG: nicotinic acid mononucleotide adenylyltransferase [Betaproteobacteria bacterium HGW-Betaproteobacteria-11]
MPEPAGSAGPLGIFGGTFDPPHIAHLRLAIEARETLKLAAVVFVPAGAPRLRAAPQAARQHRLAMVERAIATTPGLLLDTAEMLGTGPSYSVATLERLRAAHGSARPLVLLLGADAFIRLEGWHRWRELFALAHIGVAGRPGFTLDAKKTGAGETAPLTPALAEEWSARRGEAGDLAASPAGRIVPFDMPALEISASAIRARLAAGRDVRHLVTDAVLDYIDSNSLYRTTYER